MVFHVSAECYPMAKAGGLGDVVGALPKYQKKMGDESMVVMPMYDTPFLKSNSWDTIFKGKMNLGDWHFDYTIIKEQTGKLGYSLFLVDINGVLDRPKIYGYDDDISRFLAFQVSVLNWLSHWTVLPDVLHCHDHQAGLLPFMLRHCNDYQKRNGNFDGGCNWQSDHRLFIEACKSQSSIIKS